VSGHDDAAAHRPHGNGELILSRDTGVRAALRGCPVALRLPLAVLTALVVLSTLGISQSSLSLNDPTTDGSGLLAGTPRLIRHDEWGISTPTQIGNVRSGFPSVAQIGLTQTRLDATSLGVPVLDWTAVFRAQTWPLLAVGGLGGPWLGAAFAWSWWWPIAIGILGVYWLLLALRPRQHLLAGGLAMLVALGPYVGWWSGTGVGAMLGLTSAAGAAVIWGARAGGWVRPAAFGIAASWCVSAAFIELYPPWLISVGLVVAAVVVGRLLDVRPRLRPTAVTFAAAALPAVCAVGLWYAQNSSAIAAITATYYPGNRSADPGSGQWGNLLSAPTSLFLSLWPTALARGAGPDGFPNNLSEASSEWIPLPAIVALLALAAWHARRGRRDVVAASAVDHTQDDRWQSTAVSATVVLTVLLAWTFVPINVAVPVLDRVPGYRAYLAIGLASAILMHVLAGRLAWSRHTRAWTAVAVGLASLALGLATGVTLTSSPVGWWSTALLSALAGLAALALMEPGRWRLTGAVTLMVMASVVFVVIGPWYRGLGPMTQSPLAAYLASSLHREGTARWVSFYGPATPILQASGLTALSGPTYYPDPAVWQRLAPRQRKVWNNYNEIYWLPQDTRDQSWLVSRGNYRVVVLKINLCAPDTRFLDVSYAISTTPVGIGRCFSLIGHVRDLGQNLLIWQVHQ
jgi:hypothetical protein